MARIVNTEFKPILSLVVRTILLDGSFTDVVVKEGDIVTDFRYVANKKIQKITGRVSKINYKNAQVRRTYNTFKKMKSYFRFDVTPVSIEVDASTLQHSNVVVIPARDILEKEGVTGVKRIDTFFRYGFDATIHLSDNTTNIISLHEGEIVKDIIYLAKNETKVDSKIVAIKYNKVLEPLMLETITDNKIREIDVYRIKEAGSTIPVIEPGTKPITDVISGSVNKDIFISAGEFKEPINIAKEATINGDKAGVSALAASRDVKTLKDETIVSGAVNVTSTTNVGMDGVALVDNALVNLGSSAEANIDNCIIKSLNPDAPNSFVVKTGTLPALLNVQGCYFGDNKAVDGKAFRNTLELNCKLKDGTVISNNYFAKECSGNNDICIYDVEEGANITIENNVWERSANGIRIGTKGDAKCTITINNNTYHATDETYPEYAGLVLIQPYGSATTSMKNVTVHINNTHHTDNKQIYYLYSGGNDMKFTTDTLPTVYVDGVLQDLTKYING